MQWVSHRDFNNKTGIVNDMMALYPTLVSDSLLGEFLPHRFQELKQFCNRNPGYHIITSRGLCRYNKCLGNADGYHLATGSSDPGLAVDFRPYLVNYKETGREIIEESGADLSPKGRHIKTRFYT